MEAIADGIFIDTSFSGVTLGAINRTVGMILIDAPLRLEDARAWRSCYAGLSSGSERLLVNLDSHFDRTLGTRAMELTVIAHNKTAQAFRNRPMTFKTQSDGTGSEWEFIGGLGSIRWAPPDLSFSDKLKIDWGTSPVILDHRPGPSSGSIWVSMPEEKVVFIGDFVIPNQPPFLSNANLPVWIQTLHTLLTPAYDGYTLIGGRSGVVSTEDVCRQIDILMEIQAKLEELAGKKAAPDATQALIPALVARIEVPPARQEQFTQRLRWGLEHYYARWYRDADFEEDE